MLRFLPLALEFVGLIGIVVGSFMFNPALGLIAVGAAVVAVGYALEDAK